MSARNLILTTLVLVTVAQWNASRPVWADAAGRAQAKRCCAGAAPEPKAMPGHGADIRTAA